MPNFVYQIRTPFGHIQEGVMESLSATSASATLRADGNLVLQLDKTRRSVKSHKTTPKTRHLPFVRPRLATLEVTLLQLSIMLNSGLTLLEALRSTAAQSSRLMRAMLTDVAERVQEGRTFSEALRFHPWVGRMVLQLVEVGEQTGTLDVVLERAAESLEKRRLLMSQAISAMMYPMVVLLAAIGVTLFMLVYAIPRLTVYLRALGRPLPEMAQQLVDISEFLIVWWPVLTGGFILSGILFTIAYSTPPGRLLIDTVLLRIPLFGYIFRTSATAMFSRSFALLLSSGVTIIEGLRTTQELHHNRRLTVLIAKAREGVIAGASLAQGMEARKAFTPMLISMIAIGEKTGNLDRTLTSCALFHEQRLSALIRTLSSFVEIAVIIIVGAIVGYVYIAFMLALYGGA